MSRLEITAMKTDWGPKVTFFYNVYSNNVTTQVIQQRRAAAMKLLKKHRYLSFSTNENIFI